MFLHLPVATIFSTILAIVFGQDYSVYLESLKKCPVKGDKELTYQTRLDTADDGSKLFSLSMNLTRVIDKNCFYTANIELKNGGIYVPYMQMDGNVCEVFNNAMKPAWERFKQDVKPPLKEQCTINPGSYSLNSFQIRKDEVNVAIPSKGEYRTDTHMFCDNVEVVCLLAEFFVIEEDEDDDW